MFIPEAGSSVKGKVIQVIGSPFTGFGLELKRNYNVKNTGRGHELIPLATINDEHITDVIGEDPEKETRDITAHDVLEKEAKRIDAPVASRTPLDPSAENCQTWLWMYVEHLVKKELIDEAALDVLKNAKAF
ncbi:hypothetical protein E8E13_003352 [Curvularia kusanoi]|uniref:Uncharacterized protein n=1 Tax=Curvularia kusanoi TaxID=90978 RepID=A0A9P4W4N6_CURKU|nr:hypothetical protein E8E13_003352 [Curvularia kusanoi]